MDDWMEKGFSDYNVLIDGLDTPVLVFKNEACDSDCLIAANHAACQLLEYTRDELLSLPAQELPILQKIQSSPDAHFETHFASKSGRNIPIEINARRLQLAERVVILASIRDMTERALYESKRIEDENQFRTLLNSVNEAIFIHDLKDGSIIDVNRRTLEMYQYTHAEILQLSIGHLSSGIPPFTQEGAVERLQQALISGSNLFEWHARRKNGELFWVEVGINKYFLGGQTRLIVICRDIDERKKNEALVQKRLHELETVNQLFISLRAAENLKNLLDTFQNEAMLAANAENGILYLFDELEGCYRPEVVSGFFNDEPLLNISTHDPLITPLRTRACFSSENLSKDGLVSLFLTDPTLANWRGHYFSIQNTRGMIGFLLIAYPPGVELLDEIEHLVTIMCQVVGNAILRERLHEQLSLSNEELKREIRQHQITQDLLTVEKELVSVTLMSIGEGVIAVDCDGIIFLFNKVAEEITGYAIDKALEQHLSKVFTLIDTATKEPISVNIADLYKIEDLNREDQSLRFPSLSTCTGETKIISLTIAPIHFASKGRSGHVIVFRDVTELHTLEAQSLLSHQMEAIGQLAAGIAHEINTPIQYIGDNLRFMKTAFERMGETLEQYQNLVQNALETPVTAERIAQVEQLYRSKKIGMYRGELPTAVEDSLEGIERVRKIVLAIREFSHPSQKEMNYADINHGIETTVTISRNEWKYVADVRLELEERLPLVMCQIDEINQVLLNIIINAAHAIHEAQSQGSSEKGLISISSQKQENKVIIRIADTGCGMTAEIIEKIFNPFFTTKSVGSGTGQGLFLAHNIIVKKHHGFIHVESTPGKGSIFTIEIPINPRDPEE